MTDAELILLLTRKGRTQALNDAYDAVAKLVVKDDHGHNLGILSALQAIMRCR